jgi:hypothetical protein
MAIKQERKFQDGQLVLAGYIKLRMVIVSAEECVAGIRYRLGFPTKSGAIHKSRTHRFFFEKDIVEAAPQND